MKQITEILKNINFVTNLEKIKRCSTCLSCDNSESNSKCNHKNHCKFDIMNPENSVCNLWNR